MSPEVYHADHDEVPSANNAIVCLGGSLEIVSYASFIASSRLLLRASHVHQEVPQTFFRVRNTPNVLKSILPDMIGK